MKCAFGLFSRFPDIGAGAQVSHNLRIDAIAERAIFVPNDRANERLPGVRVTTSARLHLGFLDLSGEFGRRFGSLGLAIDGFETRVEMRRASHFAAAGAEAARVERLVAILAQAHGVSSALAVEVSAAIPAHAGLGSGTQLALALALAFRRLQGLDDDTFADALALARGARSGIGLALFECGGFVLDVGRGAKTALPPVVSQLTFPSDWRAVLLIDPHIGGAHGEAERAAFAVLPAFPSQTAAEICQRVLMQVLPGVAEADFEAFGAGVTAIQRRLGDHFAQAQGGGRYTSSRVGQVASRLERVGALGVGQSSWGPTGFAFARDPDEAARLATRARAEAGEALQIHIVAARGRGADVATF